MRNSTLIFLLGLCTAKAQLLLDYTPPANSQTPWYAFSPGVPAGFASRLAVGEQDVQVSSIEFRLDGALTYDFTAYLFSDSGDRPGAALGSVNRVLGPQDLHGGQALAFYEFSFPNPLMLSAGQNYWVGWGPPRLAIRRTLPTHLTLNSSLATA